MNANIKLLALLLLLILGAAGLYWLFNVLTYYSWLANQHIEGREGYEKMVYVILLAIAALVAGEVYICWKSYKMCQGRS